MPAQGTNGPPGGNSGGSNGDGPDWEAIAREQLKLSAWEFISEKLHPAYNTLANAVGERDDPDLLETTAKTEEFWELYGSEIAEIGGVDGQVVGAIEDAAALLGSAGRLARHSRDGLRDEDAQVARHAAATARRLAETFDGLAEQAETDGDGEDT